MITGRWGKDQIFIEALLLALLCRHHHHNTINVQPTYKAFHRLLARPPAFSSRAAKVCGARRSPHALLYSSSYRIPTWHESSLSKWITTPPPPLCARASEIHTYGVIITKIPYIYVASAAITAFRILHRYIQHSMYKAKARPSSTTTIFIIRNVRNVSPIPDYIHTYYNGRSSIYPTISSFLKWAKHIAVWGIVWSVISLYYL